MVLNRPNVPEGAVYWDTSTGHRYQRENDKWVRRVDLPIQHDYAAVWALLEDVNPSPEIAALVWRAVITYQAAVDEAKGKQS